VPRNVRLAEAPSYGTPAVLWDPASKGAQAYLALAAEIIEREADAPPASASRAEETLK
jgi:chromosome partitioning protein